MHNKSRVLILFPPNIYHKNNTEDTAFAVLGVAFFTTVLL